MPIANLPQAAALGFQSGEGLATNPLGDSIRGLLQVWQQKKADESQFERAMIQDELNFQREKPYKDRELELKSRELRGTLGVELDSYVEALYDKYRDDPEGALAEIAGDDPILKDEFGPFYPDYRQVLERKLANRYPAKRKTPRIGSIPSELPPRPEGMSTAGQFGRFLSSAGEVGRNLPFHLSSFGKNFVSGMTGRPETATPLSEKQANANLWLNRFMKNRSAKPWGKRT